MERLKAEKITGRPNYISRGLYDDWSLQDILRHLKKVAAHEGRKPTKSMLWRRINQQGKNEPSPRFISSRIPFRSALELIGYPNIHSWLREDYTSWGVRYLKANDAVLPTATSIDYLSKLKRGPSSAQIVNIFGRINNFKEEIWQSFQDEVEVEAEHKTTQLLLIENALGNGGLDGHLMEGVGSEEEMISRFAKYNVAKELLPQLSPESWITDSIPTPDRSFISNIRRRNDVISAGTIESTALYMGVFDDIWRPDKSYMEDLKVPAEMKEPKRVKLALARFAFSNLSNDSIAYDVP